MREMQHERRDAETEEQREDRLQQMREMQHERRGAETEEQREDRLLSAANQPSLDCGTISASRLPKCTSSAKCLLMATNTTLSGSPHKCPAFH